VAQFPSRQQSHRRPQDLTTPPLKTRIGMLSLVQDHAGLAQPTNLL
jgi:hypothetical protein